MRGLFVTGTGTGVGKTVVSAALLAAMAAAGERVRAHKPVVTGIAQEPQAGGQLQAGEQPQTGEWPPAGEWPPDHVLLARVTEMRPKDVAPLRYGPAVSPHLAARLAGETVDPEDLVIRARAAGAADATVVIEGVGGLLVPLTDDYTVRDLAVALGLPVLIAAAPGLGTINHALLSIAAARAVALEVRAVVLTPWPDRAGELELSNHDTIARLGDVEVVRLSRIAKPDPTWLAQAGDALPWRRWLGA